MKIFVVVVIGMVCCAVSGFAAEANGFRLSAQKTLLEKEKDRNAFSQWDRVEKALGIKVVAQNVSLTDLPEGTLYYSVIVKRWGSSPAIYENYTGTEKLPALSRGAEANLTIGKVPLNGYESGSNRKQYQDSIEGWQIIARHGETETIKITSTSSFEKLLSKATPARILKK